MVNSVNTNASALIALQSLNSTVAQLGAVQKRVTTGYKVADAIDDGAAFAVAQSIRSDKGAYDAVNSQLNTAKGAITVFSAAATNISDALNRAAQTLTKLTDSNLTTAMRVQYNNDFTAIKAEIANYISNSSFNGRNLLNGSFANVAVVATVKGQQYTIGGANGVSLSAACSVAFTNFASAASAAVLLTGKFASAQAIVGGVLNTLGADMRRVNSQITFNSAIQDALTTSLGAIVDADLAKESANLQSLQIKQQLGSQTLGIANSSPQILSSLFR